MTDSARVALDSGLKRPPVYPVLYRYVTSIQDEVHRFAIDYHHGLRNKTMQRSVLDEIPGIGQNRKKSLLAAFGSIEGIKNADVSELAAAEGMNRKAAEEVRLFFERRARMTEQPKAADAGGDKRKTAD